MQGQAFPKYMLDVLLCTWPGPLLYIYPVRSGLIRQGLPVDRSTCIHDKNNAKKTLRPIWR